MSLVVSYKRLTLLGLLNTMNKIKATIIKTIQNDKRFHTGLFHLLTAMHSFLIVLIIKIRELSFK